MRRESDPLRRMRVRRPAWSWILIGVAFGISRALYYFLGVRFDSSLLYQAWQILDVNLLRDRLVESLLNLHCQPPLFNLFVGLIIKVCPNHLDAVFHGVTFASGW